MLDAWVVVVVKGRPALVAMALSRRRPEGEKNRWRRRLRAPRLDSFGVVVEGDGTELVACFDLLWAASLDGGELSGHG